MQSNLTTTATLGQIESGHSRELAVMGRWGCNITFDVFCLGRGLQLFYFERMLIATYKYVTQSKYIKRQKQRPTTLGTDQVS